MSKSQSRQIADMFGYEGFDRDTCFSTRTERKYSIFQKVAGKWVRLSPLALTKKVAVHHWQSRMLTLSMQGETVALRVVTK